MMTKERRTPAAIAAHLAREAYRHLEGVDHVKPLVEELEGDPCDALARSCERVLQTRKMNRGGMHRRRTQLNGMPEESLRYSFVGYESHGFHGRKPDRRARWQSPNRRVHAEMLVIPEEVGIEELLGDYAPEVVDPLELAFWQEMEAAYDELWFIEADLAWMDRDSRCGFLGAGVFLDDSYDYYDESYEEKTVPGVFLSGYPFSWADGDQYLHEEVERLDREIWDDIDWYGDPDLSLPAQGTRFVGRGFVYNDDKKGGGRTYGPRGRRHAPLLSERRSSVKYLSH